MCLGGLGKPKAAHSSLRLHSYSNSNHSSLAACHGQYSNSSRGFLVIFFSLVPGAWHLSDTESSHGLIEVANALGRGGGATRVAGEGVGIKLPDVRKDSVDFVPAVACEHLELWPPEGAQRKSVP